MRTLVLAMCLFLASLTRASEQGTPGERKAFEEFRVKAETGNAEAQYRLAVCYSEGKNVAKDKAEAAKWFRKAAEHDHAKAQYKLGRCYQQGAGVAKDEAEAAKWYGKAVESLRRPAEMGDAEAQNDLGNCFHNGNGRLQDYAQAFNWYRKAAEQGNALAQYNLGICFDNGRGVPKDCGEAFKWYRKGADQGNVDAQYNLGLCYISGSGVVRDEYESFKWYRKAAEQGDAEAQLEVGGCYGLGAGVWKNEAEEVKWYRRAAEQGNSEAESMLGFCYEDGTGVPKNEPEAVKWYRKSAESLRKDAEQGDAEAQYKLGTYYAEGKGVSKNEAEASNWFRKAADSLRMAAEQGDANAQAKLARDYENGTGVPKDEVEAAKRYRRAAEQGNAEAEFMLGICYDKGRGVPKDESEAVNWYRKAAEEGNHWAQNELGNYYKLGRGVAKDNSEAVKWYRKAAEQGVTDALVSLGECYHNGVGVGKDEAESLKWFRKAAEQGNAKCQYIIGFGYKLGLTLPKDEMESYKWLSLAASHSEKGAKEALENLKAEMTREQIAEGRRLAAVVAAFNPAPTYLSGSIAPEIEEGALKAHFDIEAEHRTVRFEFQRTISDHKYHLYSSVATTKGLDLSNGKGLTALVEGKKFYLGSLRDKPTPSYLFWVDLDKLTNMPKSAELEALVKTNGQLFIKREEGVVETCYSTISQAQIQWLCSATNLQFRFEGKAGTNSLDMPDAAYLLSTFWSQCEAADDSIPKPATPEKKPPPLKPEPGIFSILKIDGKMVEPGSLYDKWSYLITIGNGTFRPQKNTLKIQFIDASGFVLEERLLEAYVEAGAVQTFTDSVLISTPNSPKVRSVSARFWGGQEETGADIQNGLHGPLTPEENQFKRENHELYLKHALLLQKLSKELPPDVLEKRAVHEAMVAKKNIYLNETAPIYHPGPLQPIPH